MTAKSGDGKENCTFKYSLWFAYDDSKSKCVQWE